MSQDAPQSRPACPLRPLRTARPAYEGPDKHLGYPTLVKLAAYPESHFVIGAGNLVYYDFPARDTAKNLPELRPKWQQ